MPPFVGAFFARGLPTHSTTNIIRGMELRVDLAVLRAAEASRRTAGTS